MSETLENLSVEERRFPPPEGFAAQANVKADAYDEANADRLAFWAKAAERLTWAEKWTDVLDWSDAPFAKWFVGGKLNVAYNCLDRHVEGGHAIRSPITGRVSRATTGRSPTHSSRTRCARRRTR